MNYNFNWSQLDVKRFIRRMKISNLMKTHLSDDEIEIIEYIKEMVGELDLFETENIPHKSYLFNKDGKLICEFLKNSPHLIQLRCDFFNIITQVYKIHKINITLIFNYLGDLKIHDKEIFPMNLSHYTVYYVENIYKKNKK